jgi:hypothetical protein
MDYNQLAREFGGIPASAPPKEEVDYAALASEFGGSLAPAAPAPKQEVDYSSLAAEFGGTPLSRGTGELAVAGTETGVTGLKSMGQGLSILRNVSAVDRITSALSTYDAIDKGEIKSPAQASQKGFNATSASKYLRATPEARIKMRENQFENESERKALIGDSIKLFQQYQKEMAAQGKGVPNFTDIGSMDGFRQWLTFNLPSTAVQLAPIMAAAVTTGGAGAFTLGAGMAVGETVGNRLQFITDKVKDLPPEEQADKIEQYIRDTRDTTLAIGLASGALDLTGVVGAILKQRAGKEGIKYLTKREAVKAGAKEAPKIIGAEAATGAGQETLQILGEKKLGEMEEDLISKKNFKRIADASAVEALGGSVGAGVITTARVGQTALDQRAERLEREEIDREIKQAAVAANAATLSPEYSGIVDKYLAEGKSQAEAFKLAGAELSEREIEGGPTRPEAGRVEPTISVPSGEGAVAQPTVAPEEPPAGRVEPTGVGVSGVGTRAEQVSPALTEADVTAKYVPNVAQAITIRAGELVQEGATLPVALQAAEAEVVEGLPETEILAAPPAAEVTAPPTVEATPTVEPTVLEAAPTVEPTVTEAAPAEPVVTPTGLAPAGKPRGRPKAVKTPEQIAVDQERRRASQGAGRDAIRLAERAQKTVETPFDEGAFPNDVELAAGLEARNAEVVDALTDAYRISTDPKFRKNKAGQIAQATIDNPNVTPRQREIAQNRAKRPDAARMDMLTESTNPQPDTFYETVTDASDGINYIIKTGNPFEKLLAQRIKNFLKGVKVVVVNDPNTDITNPETRKNFSGAMGLYVEKDRTIYLSNLPGFEGINNMTFLHEALHGATIKQISAWTLDRGSVSPQARAAIEDLQRVMLQAYKHYALKNVKGRTDPVEDILYDLGAFTDLKEFVAYGLSQPEMQYFLLEVPGTTKAGERLSRGVFTRFVDSVRKMFNIGAKDANAFLDLVAVTDQLLRSPDVAPEGTSSAAAKKIAVKKKKADKTTLKILLSNKYSDLNASIGDLMKQVRDSKDALDLLKSLYGAMSVGAIRKMVAVLTTMDITRWAGDRIANLKNVNKAVQEMAGMRAKMIRELAEKVPEWVNYAKKYEQGGRLLGTLMHRSTLTQVDPTKYGNLNDALQNDPVLRASESKAQDQNLTPNQRRYHQGEVTKRKNDITRVYEMWDQLGAIGQGKGHDIFRMAKETYLDTFNLHQSLLTDKIAASNVPGDVNDASTPKGKLIASITQSFQDAASMDIYFPLMRYGNYWFRVGKGKAGEFYMFETATARNNAVRKRIAELQRAGDKRSFDEMVESQDIDFGDDLRQMRAEIVESSQMLKSIFQMLDQNKMTDVEALKDQVYQMYLMTLPEKDIRKRFTHRQGKTGFSADVIRNFIVSQHTAANQLSRLKYSDSIRNAIGSAYAELAGNPDKLKLNAFIDEVAMRAAGEMTPPVTGEFDWDKLASLGNQAVFYYMLTSPKSALVQMTQLPVVGLPVLLANYDATEVTKTVARYSNLFNKFGVHKRDEQGNVSTEWSQPSIRDSGYVNNHPDTKYRSILRDAWEYANDRDIFMATYTADLTSRAKAPTAEYAGWFTAGRRALGNMMSGAFHHVERIARETMYMSTFELEFARQRKAGKSDTEAATIAKEKAIEIVYESLFNYTQYNKPRIMKTPVGKVATQFLSYPLQVTSYLYRNFVNMLPFLNKQGKREAAIQFFGTVGMTAMFSGVVGLPMYSMIMGMVDGLRDMWRPEDDEDYDEDDEGNPLAYRNIDLWFREWFIPTYFGEGSSIAKALGLSDEQAQTLARAIKYGPISAYTNQNIGASVSLDGLWFRDDTPAEDAKSAVQEMFFNLFGGPLGSGIQQIASAFDDFNNGQWERGVEKMLPAFFRGAMKSYRLNTEGLKTTKGDEVMNAEYYTTGKLIAQSMGFEPTKVAEVQKANFMAKRLETQIFKEKNSLLNKLDIAVRRAEDRDTEAAEENVEKVLEEIDAYNIKNGFGPFLINAETIQTSLKGREKRRGQSFQGLSVEKKAAPFIEPLIERSRSPEYR